MHRHHRRQPAGFGCQYYKHHHRCPVCCIVPPYMLEKLAVNGNEGQREWAFETLNLSSEFRGRRKAVGNIHFAVSPGVKKRAIYDAENGENLPGKLVRSEGDPPSPDAKVNEAYDATGATYDFFAEIFERNSIDDRGLILDSTVHYGVKYDNAFWNGDQMVYGDGDGEIFHRFTKSLDVIAHELTHGVTQYEGNMMYFGESGALNESMSDVFGTLVKQWVNKQTVETADWIIGTGLFTDKVKGVGIRSMKAPGTAYDDPVLGKDIQPAHMNDIYTGFKDNGGVHINSGIPNHAFYLAAMSMGGYAWEKAGKIWYITLRDRLRRMTSFRQAAAITVRVASELYGEGSPEQKAVRYGWEKVGVISPR